jgi:cytochrome c5
MIIIPFKENLVGAVLAVLIFVALSSCTHEPAAIDLMDPVCFDTQVLPILQTSCGMSGCHDGVSGEGGFDASSYETVMDYVSAGDPRGSKLYNIITKINGENMMPPDRPLSIEQRSIIEVWIAQGANNILCKNDTGTGGGNDSICFVQNILPMFISNCAMSSCHDGLSQSEDDLYALNSYATIRQHVTPFNPSASAVYRAVNGQSEEFMPPPPKSPLTTAQKTLMRTWIADGALNSDCPDANCDTAATTVISYANVVKPIIDNYCLSCHNATVTSGGVNLNGYNQVKTYAESLRNGTPILLGTIQQIAGFKAMPPSIKLDKCSIREIELWITQGRLNN